VNANTTITAANIANVNDKFYSLVEGDAPHGFRPVDKRYPVRFSLRFNRTTKVTSTCRVSPEGASLLLSWGSAAIRFNYQDVSLAW
jgi:hypothetical protein